MNRALAFLMVAILPACGSDHKSGGATSTGGTVEDITDRSVCGAPTINPAPLAGTSWTQTLRWQNRVRWVRSISFVGSTVVLRQKATEIASGKSESLRAIVRPSGNTYNASELDAPVKTLTLNDGTTFSFNFEANAGTIRFARIGNCLSIDNGKETTILTPEL